MANTTEMKRKKILSANVGNKSKKNKSIVFFNNNIITNAMKNESVVLFSFLLFLL